LHGFESFVLLGLLSENRSLAQPTLFVRLTVSLVAKEFDMSHTYEKAMQQDCETPVSSDKCDSNQANDFPFMIAASHKPLTEEEYALQQVWTERMLATSSFYQRQEHSGETGAFKVDLEMKLFLKK